MKKGAMHMRMGFSHCLEIVKRGIFVVHNRLPVESNFFLTKKFPDCSILKLIAPSKCLL